MPKISLVVCVHKQRQLLERLIRESRGCYDELVVEHDVPDTENIKEVVAAAGGKFFERPPVFLQEPHWPFLWAQAAHDWILRMDADEFPSTELKIWLQEFRRAPEPPTEVSGYTCIWPLWNGCRAVSKKWPAGHVFLFNKQRVRFFGMCEQGPVPDGKFLPLDLTLHHQPARVSFSLHNMIFRKQAREGRASIVKCLLGKPTDLACWRWTDEQWPLQWEQIRQHPLQTSLRRLVMGTLRGLRDQWRAERRLFPIPAVAGPIFHFLTCLKFWQERPRNF